VIALEDEMESGGVEGGVWSCGREAGCGPGEQNGRWRVGSALVVTAVAASEAFEGDFDVRDEGEVGAIVETANGRANSVAIEIQ
jgi:hypothetical protein